jgi:hypothetical protein
MAVPFFFRKKFMLYYGLFVLLLLLTGGGWTTLNYLDAQATTVIRWEKITIPLALPLFGIAGYIVFALIWLRYKLASRDNGLPDLYTPVPTPLATGEKQFGDPDPVDHTAPNGNTTHGEIRFTNQRLVFTQAVDLKTLAAQHATKIPEHSITFLWSAIHQCRFGMHDERLKYLIVVLNNRSEHTFGPIVKFNIESAMKELKWTRKEVTGYTYWMR